MKKFLCLTLAGVMFLAGCGGRVAQAVESVRSLTNDRIQSGHFGVSTSIVSDRTISVGCQCDTQRAEHTNRGDAYTVKPQGEVVDVREIPAVGKAKGG